MGTVQKIRGDGSEALVVGQGKFTSIILYCVLNFPWGGGRFAPDDITLPEGCLKEILKNCRDN